MASRDMARYLAMALPPEGLAAALEAGLFTLSEEELAVVANAREYDLVPEMMAMSIGGGQQLLQPGAPEQGPPPPQPASGSEPVPGPNGAAPITPAELPARRASDKGRPLAELARFDIYLADGPSPQPLRIRRSRSASVGVQDVPISETGSLGELASIAGGYGGSKAVAAQPASVIDQAIDNYLQHHRNVIDLFKYFDSLHKREGDEASGKKAQGLANLAAQGLDAIGRLMQANDAFLENQIGVQGPELAALIPLADHGWAIMAQALAVSKATRTTVAMGGSPMLLRDGKPTYGRRSEREGLAFAERDLLATGIDLYLQKEVADRVDASFDAPLWKKKVREYLDEAKILGLPTVSENAVVRGVATFAEEGLAAVKQMWDKFLVQHRAGGREREAGLLRMYDWAADMAAYMNQQYNGRRLYDVRDILGMVFEGNENKVMEVLRAKSITPDEVPARPKLDKKLIPELMRRGWAAMGLGFLAGATAPGGTGGARGSGRAAAGGGRPQRAPNLLDEVLRRPSKGGLQGRPAPAPSRKSLEERRRAWQDSLPEWMQFRRRK